jgi:Fe-S oxidoreductase
LQHYYDANGVPFRSRLIANFTTSARLAALMPSLYNFAVTNGAISTWIKKLSGFAVDRSLPTVHSTTLQKWHARHSKKNNNGGAKRKVYLFCDEFTNYNDTEIGIKAILLLEKLGYQVCIPRHTESGRAWLSKGLLRTAKKIANANIQMLKDVITADSPLIGIEPSAILTFRDEYIDLATDENFEAAKAMSKHVFMIDEFIAAEAANGHIKASQFTSQSRKIVLHGHCQQKALGSVAASAKLLAIPQNYTVETIPSGCCGMAGSFGYEKEHYELSMQVGELVLLPTVRKQTADVIVAAPGTSCRHQVKDGTGRKAQHPVEILYEALV